MAMENNHTNFIHTIDIGGVSYEVHDINAIHTLADLANLGVSTEGVFIYKGTVATVADLPTSGNKVGHVYHVTANHSEYVWAKVDGGTKESWEEFGEHFVINHTHDVTVTGTNAASAVTGSATVTGGNSSSDVTGSVTVAGVPNVSETPIYAKVSTGNDTFVKSYPGAFGKMVTTSVTPAGAATDVINSITPTTESITGVSGSTTASKASAGTAVTLATRASSQTTVGNANVGTAVSVTTGLKGGKTAEWSASVTNGVLSFSFKTNELQEPDNTSITPAATSTTKIYGVGGTKSITPYTFTDVTVPTAATKATTVVTGVDTDTIGVATVGSSVTLATGSVTSSGKGSTVMTGLGTATTGSALNSASLVAGTSTDGMYTGDDITITTKEITAAVSATAAPQVWTQNTGSISGTAAAQKWTGSGVTSAPKS